MRYNHLSISKPPRDGEPIMTASVMITPKTIPTKIKRLFISKIIQTQIKMKCHSTCQECNYLEKNPNRQYEITQIGFRD
ncbi:MAG: hypothetical protein K8Q89_09970 [Nitrosarchaeum sp.]|nr:hypothetical protein [Nitrosarchaeum sp.]